MRLGKVACVLTNRHRWEKKLSEIPADSVFFRVDCERCGEAMDGAALVRICARVSPDVRAFMLRSIGMDP